MTSTERSFSLQEGHLEICGAIAAGKTTLAQLLAEEGDLRLIEEDFRAVPFFEAFYSDPVVFGFEAELSFTLQHYHKVKVAARVRSPFVCDFSPIQDLAYADVTLDGAEKDAYVAVHEVMLRHLPAPRVLVYLECDTSVLLARIRARKRRGEESIDEGYLRAVDAALRSRLQEVESDTTVMSINTGDVDFTPEGTGRFEAINALSRARA